tara:strand:+ start:381 stop:662 length:282 start_codon:yes stop_codon:yes gene_type:complete
VKDIINNIEAKLIKFIEKHELLKKEVVLLKQENNIFSIDLKSKEKEISDLHEKIKLINLTNSGYTSDNDLKQTKMKVNEYVREIDKCIALLNN